MNRAATSTTSPGSSFQVSSRPRSHGRRALAVAQQGAPLLGVDVDVVRDVAGVAQPPPLHGAQPGAVVDPVGVEGTAVDRPGAAVAAGAGRGRTSTSCDTFAGTGGPARARAAATAAASGPRAGPPHPELHQAARLGRVVPVVAVGARHRREHDALARLAVEVDEDVGALGRARAARRSGRRAGAAGRCRCRSGGTGGRRRARSCSAEKRRRVEQPQAVAGRRTRRGTARSGR